MGTGELRRWREGWDGERRGRGCPLCRLIGVVDNDWGQRVFVGAYLDAYLVSPAAFAIAAKRLPAALR